MTFTGTLRRDTAEVTHLGDRYIFAVSKHDDVLHLRMTHSHALDDEMKSTPWDYCTGEVSSDRKTCVLRFWAMRVLMDVGPFLHGEYALVERETGFRFEELPGDRVLVA